MESILSVAGLDIGYKKRMVASDINLSLACGEVTALIGRNGAGKSTLIKTLTKSLPAKGGNIYIEGKPLERYGRRELAEKIAIVANEQTVSGGFRLRELVGLGRTPFLNRLGILDDEDKRLVERAMEAVGVAYKADSYVAELSDGERQRGMIARGLVQQTPIIIMDEPFSFLDVAARIEIMALLKEIAGSEGKAILYSTHEVTQALRMADRLWVFLNAPESGQSIVREGAPREIIEKGFLDRLFDETQVKFDPEIMDFRYIDPRNGAAGT